MSENKKYYYMKLKENFFSSERMVVLETMPDGILYSNLLLKMYLMSLKHNAMGFSCYMKICRTRRRPLQRLPAIRSAP